MSNGFQAPSSGRADYYEILEISPSATNAEILRAYQRARETYSVDNPALYSMFSREEAIEILKLVEEAYSVLGNPNMRRSYDTERASGSADRSRIDREAVSAHISAVLSSGIAHGELPDLTVPDPAIPGSVVLSPTPQFATGPADRTPKKTEVIASGDDYIVRKIESAQIVPDGMARTPLSIYQVNPSFEKEIQEWTDFDGQRLKRIREYKQIDLGKLSEVSKIGKTHLLALEANDFRFLPAAVFLRGILVQVSKYLGLDDKLVTASYLKMMSDKQG